MSFSKNVLLAEIFEIQILEFFNRMGGKRTSVALGGLQTFAAVANVGTDFHKADLCIVWANGKSANSG